MSKDGGFNNDCDKLCMRS